MNQKQPILQETDRNNSILAEVLESDKHDPLGFGGPSPKP